jgi:hypothetical protein
MNRIGKLLTGIGVSTALAVSTLASVPAANAAPLAVAKADAYQSTAFMYAFVNDSYRWGLELKPVGNAKITARAGKKVEKVPAHWNLSTFSQLTFEGSDSEQFQNRPAVNLNWYQAQYFRLNLKSLPGDDSYGATGDFASLDAMYGWYDSIIKTKTATAKGWFDMRTRYDAAKADVEKNSIATLNAIGKIGLPKFLANPKKYTKTLQKKLHKSGLYRGSIKYAISRINTVDYQDGYKEKVVHYTITVNDKDDLSRFVGADGNTHEGGGYTTVKVIPYGRD